MFRLLFKTVVVLVLVFFIGNYLVYLNTGQMPLRDLREHMGHDWWVDVRELLSTNVSPDALADDAKQAVKKVSDTVSEPEAPAPTKVYKWTDAEGRVHFGDKPVASGAEEIEVDTRNAISPPDELAPLAERELAPQATAQESAVGKARAAAEAMRLRALQQEQAQ